MHFDRDIDIEMGHSLIDNILHLDDMNSFDKDLVISSSNRENEEFSPNDKQEENRNRSDIPTQQIGEVLDYILIRKLRFGSKMDENE
jgi:sporulation protein YlmC with PRC-barrel domain